MRGGIGGGQRAELADRPLERLFAILAQRLVRRICQHCKQPYQPDELEQTWLAHFKARGELKFWQGRGCQSCNFSGYKGRLGVFELLVINKPLADALRRSLAARRLIGARALLVHAIDEQAAAFYRSLGFRPSPLSASTLMLQLSEPAN